MHSIEHSFSMHSAAYYRLLSLSAGRLLAITVAFIVLKMKSIVLSGFPQVREKWKKSGNLSGQGKVRGNYFLDKSGESQGK